MKNGTQSNRLTLVDRNGCRIPEVTDSEETSVEYVASSTNDSSQINTKDIVNDAGIHSQLIAFAAVSIGCAVAAIATGSYALWLSRRRLADQTLLSVHELLETCRDRVTRMEEELTHLSAPQTFGHSS